MTSRLSCIAAALCVGACSRPEPTPAPTPEASHGSAVVASGPRVVATLEHSTGAFTQGLAFWQGRLFEGTGYYGQSALRELDPKTGKELRHLDIGARYFGEGITVLDGRLYELTWKEQTCLVYDVETFQKIGALAYEGEGWGITNDGSQLITSDGSSKIQFRDPGTFKTKRTITVISNQDVPVTNLNELELVDGVIWANVWTTDVIVKISPDTGRVIELFDTTKLLAQRTRASDPDDVLNGIAYEPTSHRLLLTGKRWPQMFEISTK